MKIVLLNSVLFFSPFLFSAVADFTVEGIVVSYDKKKVVLAQDNGKKIKVSRNRISKNFKLKTGARVIAVIPGEKIIKLLKKQEDKNSNKTQPKKRSKL